MTTIVYCRKTKTIAADSQNTDASNGIWRMNKIEVLPDGSIFLGSGHCYTIGQCKLWASKGFNEVHRPDFSYFLEDEEERGFSCMLVSKDGSKVIMVDDEMCPTEVLNDFCAVGSGSSWALGALEAGATAVKAVEVACLHDIYTSLPINTHHFGENNGEA